MFTLAELDEDPSLILDLKDDVREECESFGKVTNVVLWDKEPEGIMTVKFQSHDAAWACVQVSSIDQTSVTVINTLSVSVRRWTIASSEVVR